MEVGQAAHCVSPWSEPAGIKGMKMNVFPQCLSLAAAGRGGVGGGGVSQLPKNMKMNSDPKSVK